MSLSIVTCVYNGSKFIDYYWSGMLEIIDMVDSVIIVNDGSTDDTYKKLQNINSNKLKIINKENSGLPASRNIGFELVNSKYVIFLDVDDILYKTTLFKLINRIEDSNADIIYGNVSYVNEQGHSTKMMYIWSFLKKLKFVTSKDTNSKIFMNNFLVTPGSIMFRTKYIENYKFNENLTIGEDWEFFTRVFPNANIESINDTMIRYMIVNASMSLTTMKDINKLTILTNSLVDNYKIAFPEYDYKKYENHINIVNRLFQLQRSGYKESFFTLISMYFMFLKTSPQSNKIIVNSFVKMLLSKILSSDN